MPRVREHLQLGTMDGNFKVGRFGGIEVRLHWSLLGQDNRVSGSGAGAAPV